MNFLIDVLVNAVKGILSFFISIIIIIIFFSIVGALFTPTTKEEITVSKNSLLHINNLNIIGDRDTKGDELDINFVTDYFTITCHHGKRSFTSFKQQLVSILPVEDIQSITTEGLEFPLIDEPFPLSSRGISNRATGHQFIITSSGKIWVFRSHSD